MNTSNNPLASAESKTFRPKTIIILLLLLCAAAFRPDSARAQVVVGDTAFRFAAPDLEEQQRATLPARTCSPCRTVSGKTVRAAIPCRRINRHPVTA